MATYAIGDVQGCYRSLLELLDKIEFNPDQDTLWFCGDLVNRGPHSLEVLRFVHGLGSSAITVLGNHDLHLLAIWSGSANQAPNESLKPIFDAPDCDALMHWLRCRPLLHVDASHRWAMVHAALLPQWSLEKALNLAHEVEQVLSGEDYKSFFNTMYGNHPNPWHDNLHGDDRLRCITNVMTRLRYLAADSTMALDCKLAPADEDSSLTPWFQTGSLSSTSDGTRIVFGHWSTLAIGQYGQTYAIDAGCLWGGQLVALRLDSDQPEWFEYDCPQTHTPNA